MPDLWPALLAVEPPHQPRVPLWVLEWGLWGFIYAWLFWVGACVGSFLNVVVYRLPRGKSLAHPGSYCPRCRRPIRLRDNIPLLSWLALRGRCRDCASPIPARYFLVELAVATLFVAVAVIETRIPGGYARAPAEGLRRLISTYEALPFWTAYATHVVLLTTLLGAALIDASGHRTPRRMFVPVTILGFYPPLVWPEVRRWPAFAYQVGAAWQPGLIDGLVGIAAGAAIGVIVGAAWWRGRLGDWPRSAPIALFAAVGVVSGWQMALETAAAATLLLVGAIGLLRMSSSQRIVPLALFVFVAALPRVIDLDVRLGMAVVWPARYELAIAVALVAIASTAAHAAGRLAPPQYYAPPPEDPPEVELPGEAVEGQSAEMAASKDRTAIQSPEPSGDDGSPIEAAEASDAAQAIDESMQDREPRSNGG